MATTLPVPIEFELPHGWHAVPPDDVGATGSAFVARYRESDAGFVPNITISASYQPGEQPLTEIADNAVDGLRAEFSDVELVRRDEAGTEEAPGVVQQLRLIAELPTGRRLLAQQQVHLAMHDVNDPARRVVLHLTLTSTEEQLDTVLGDFRKFVASVRPE